MHEQGGWVQDNKNGTQIQKEILTRREGEGSGRGEALVLTWRGAGANMSELGAELGWSLRAKDDLTLIFSMIQSTERSGLVIL